MNAKPLLYSALIVALALTTGCQSWQGASFPMQNATRVPPPGTGTYQMPSGYYNNTSTSSLPAASLPQASQTMQANNSATGSSQAANSGGAGGEVVQAAFQSSQANTSAAAGSPVATAQFNDSGNGFSSGAAANLSGSSSAETPSLQWQQFDGR